jgi:hypothetical protein
MATNIPDSSEPISKIDPKTIKIPQPTTIEPGAPASPEAAVTAARAPTTPPPDDEVIARLAAMKPLEYERARVEISRRLGCRPTVLDALVKATLHHDDASSSLPFPDVEPFPTPVEPGLLLDELSATIRRFIVMDEEQTDAAALWVALTWFIDAVEGCWTRWGACRPDLCPYPMRRWRVCSGRSSFGGPPC